jgi:DNA primase
VPVEELHATNQAAVEALASPARQVIAARYLQQRGIEPRDLTGDWQIGYAPPGWTRLVDQLRAAGFTDQHLLTAGLARTCRRGTLIDSYRDRLILPLHDDRHRVIGFLGRDLSGAPDTPKYLNTPTTPLYRKGELLYGQQHDTSMLGFRPVLVEGPLDVLAVTAAAHRDGDTDLLPLAPCGTALTSVQARHVTRIAYEHDVAVVIAMDGDAPGRTAALAAGRLIHQHGADVRVTLLPTGLDPASYLAQRGKTTGVFRADHALPLVVAQVEHRIAQLGPDLQWVDGRLTAARAIAHDLIMHTVEYAVEQAGWIAAALDLNPSAVISALGCAYQHSGNLPPPGASPAADLLQAGIRYAAGADIPEPQLPSAVIPRAPADCDATISTHTNPTL